MKLMYYITEEIMMQLVQHASILMEENDKLLAVRKRGRFR